MAVSAATSVELLIPDLARRARAASRKLATSTREQRRVALEAMADALAAAADQIVAANALDLAAADAKAETASIPQPMDRRTQVGEKPRSICAGE